MESGGSPDKCVCSIENLGGEGQCKCGMYKSDFLFSNK
jgi:hypothetical protein